MDDLRSILEEMPVFDVHEHHMPEILADRSVGLLALLSQSYAGWTQARPYPLPSELQSPKAAPEDPMFADMEMGRWEDVARFVEQSGSSMFVRNMVGALSELYGLGDEGITAENWRTLDAKIRRCKSDPSWHSEVLDRAGIRRIITDPFSNPLPDVRPELGDRYQSVLRINALAFGWHPDSRDHNGNSAHEFAQQLGHRLNNFDDYLTMLELLLDTLGERHQVGLKNALAYDRSVNFDDIDVRLARQAWGQPCPSKSQRKAFGDVVVNRLCQLAGERNIPVQMHLGSALIRGSHPLGAAGLIERHPNTRFLLMHLAYPWSRELLGLAFVYRNIWLDLSWSALLGPTQFKQTLHEAIEILPDESRLMIGGDNWHAEETYGAIQLFRKLIGEVLQEKVANRYFAENDAKRLARKILYENAAAFFGE